MSNDIKYIKYGKLLPGLIHNLNTPLMGCSGRVEILQMKMGEDKHLSQMVTQLDRINDMLKAVAFLLDKDLVDKDSGFELKQFLENYFAFLTTDMRFKHQLEKEFNLEQCNINTNPSHLMNYIHETLDYFLNFIEGASLLQISNGTENNTPCINFNLIFDTVINPDYIEPLKNMNNHIKESIEKDWSSRYHLEVVISNNVLLKIFVPQEL